MYNIHILPTAWEDLKEIQDYYFLAFDAKTADKVTNNILNSIKILEQFPDSGSRTPDEFLNEQGYRMVICKKQVAIYKHIDNDIYIYHIADTRKDYTKLFY